MAFVGAGRLDLVERALAAMARQAASGAPGGNGMMTRDVGLPLGRALVAFSRGDHDTCIDLLLGMRQHAHRFGGSHAQRDVVHLTLLESALRAGRTRLAQALAAERTAQKPESPFNRLLAARRAGVVFRVGAEPVGLPGRQGRPRVQAAQRGRRPRHGLLARRLRRRRRRPCRSCRSCRR